MQAPKPSFSLQTWIFFSNWLFYNFFKLSLLKAFTLITKNILISSKDHSNTNQAMVRMSTLRYASEK